MVISDKHKYLFIELYRTGSTAISSELCELYDGKKILSKHSRYSEFLKTATPEQKKYFVFSSVRNPLDMVASGYSKLKNNHKGRYTNPEDWRINGGTISNKNLNIYRDVIDNNLSFKEYLEKYYKLPYDDWSRGAHKQMNYIIRYENIQNDFAEVLKRLYIKPARPLPVINKTAGKENYINYYTPDVRTKAVNTFGPFMREWKYNFPADWSNKKASIFSFIVFKIAGVIKQNYWKLTKTKSVPA